MMNFRVIHASVARFGIKIFERLDRHLEPFEFAIRCEIIVIEAHHLYRIAEKYHIDVH